MESYLKEKLIGFAFGCGVLVIAIQIFRYMAYIVFVQTYPMWTMALCLILSAATFVLSIAQYRWSTPTNSLFLLLNGFLLVGSHSISISADFYRLTIGHQYGNDEHQIWGFIYLFFAIMCSWIVFLPLFEFLRLSMLNFQFERNIYENAKNASVITTQCN